MIDHYKFGGAAPLRLDDSPVSRHPALHNDPGGVWHANQLGSGHLVHFEISRKNVIRCIWIDRLPLPPTDEETDPDTTPQSDYVM